jgi:hypothetical protein
LPRRGFLDDRYENVERKANGELVTEPRPVSWMLKKGVGAGYGSGHRRRQAGSKSQVFGGGRTKPLFTKVDDSKPGTKVVRPGLVLLRMATDKGKLITEF